MRTGSGRSHITNERLQAHLLGLLPPREAEIVAAHLRGCAECRAAYSDLEERVAPLKEMAAPPIPIAVRRRHIAAGLDATPAVGSRSPAWRVGLGLTVAAAIAVIVVLTVARPVSESPAVRVASGTLQRDGTPLRAGDSLAFDWELEATTDVTLVAGDGTEILASRGSRFTVRHAKGWRWRVERGSSQIHSTAQPQGAPLVVATAEVVVRVVGTRFSVTRAQSGDGRPQTTVTVSEGSVVAEDRSHTERLLRAGDQGVWPAEPAVVAPAAETPHPVSSAGAEPQPDAPDRDRRGRTQESSRQVSASVAQEIRERIRHGDTGTARRLIHEARVNNAGATSLLAELRVLEAEADLAEGKRASAVERYLDVALEYPGTPQAEAALFAAAQLAAEQPGTGYDAALLLRDYMKRYPRGQFAREAEGLLTGLEQEER